MLTLAYLGEEPEGIALQDCVRQERLEEGGGEAGDGELARLFPAVQDEVEKEEVEAPRREERVTVRLGRRRRRRCCSACGGRGGGGGRGGLHHAAESRQEGHRGGLHHVLVEGERRLGHDGLAQE